MISNFFYSRPRRNRKSCAIRSLVQETRLHPSDLICPQFVIEGTQTKQPITSMPGIYRLSLDLLMQKAESLIKLGIPALALFPVINKNQKDFTGSEALNPKGLLQTAIKTLKKGFPELCVITDVALDPYTSHGHDGLVGVNGEILNDETVGILAQMALIQAEAGADVVAPSDMMDGRVRAIRAALDKNGHDQVSILSYTAKYASVFYGPFREALGSTLSFGNKQSYQMNPANQKEALIEAALDEQEGADILMVKPALPYLDVIAKIRAKTSLPIAAYHVSGEYAMVMAAAERGWLDGDRALFESVLSIKRAGANMILTYGAAKLAKMI